MKKSLLREPVNELIFINVFLLALSSFNNSGIILHQK